MDNRKIIIVLLLCLSSILTLAQDIEYTPQYADSCYIKGIAEFRNQNFKVAKTCFDLSWEINDSIQRNEPYLSSNAFCWLAYLLYLEGEKEEAQDISVDYCLLPVDQRMTLESDSLWILASECSDLRQSLVFSETARSIEINNLGHRHYYIANSDQQIASVYMQLNQWDSAKYYQEEAIDIFEEYFDSDYTQNYIITLLEYIRTCVHLSDFDAYKKTINKCKLSAQKLFGLTSSNYAYTLYEISRANNYFDDFVDCISNAKDAISVYSHFLPSKEIEMRLVLCYQLLGNAYGYVNNYQTAKDYLQKANDILEKDKSIADEILFDTAYYQGKCGDLTAQYYTNTHNDAICLHERALEFHEIGQNVEAYNMTIKALSVLESYDLDETPLYSECLHDAGMFALLAFNDISLFSTYMEKAINLKYDLYGFCNDYYWSKECFANGLVYLANRIVFPQNIDLWESAIKLYEEIPNHILMNGYTQALNNLAVNYESINVNKSIEICRKLLDIKRKTQDADSLITISNLSQFYIDIDNEKSLFYANMVLEARKKAEPIDYDKIRVSHLRVASILGRMKIYDEAISHSIEAKILAERLYGKNSAEYARSNQNMGLYYSMKGDKLKSLEYTKQAYLSPHGDKQATAANLAATYSALNEVDSCYKYTQESWLLFYNNYLYELNDMSNEENRFYFSSTVLNSGLKTLPINYFLQHENHDGFKKLAFDCILFCKNIIPDCKNRNEQLKKSIAINLDSIKSYLGNNDVAIEYWSDDELNWDGNGNIIVAIMRNNYQVPIYVKLPKEKIYKALGNEYKTTRAYLPLYENIWKEIIEKAQIKEGERLFLSLDAILSQTPIEYICNYDWEYMGDKYDIVRVSSTIVIPQISQELDVTSVALFGGLFYDSIPSVDSKLNYISQKRLLGKNNMYYEISDSLASDLRSNTKYLPWTKVEIDSIQAILSNSFINNIVYQAENGTEESFKLLSGKSPNIIHISTHGFCVQPKESMDWYEYYRYCMEHSGLLMSGVLSTDSINKDSMIVEDGFLRSTEIAELDLTKTKLLVLSACKTGLGGVSPYGMFGLQRAFKAAGVETILLTLSDVDDAATCFLMTNFYRNLMKGMSKREALKEAQLLLRTDEKFKSFNYWGSFIMID